MSSQKGNIQRSRKPKYQNAFAFKNTMHDSSGKNKKLNQLGFPSLCLRCVEKLQWKIKYKKYKPLTQARKCVKCEQRTVKQAYYIMCVPCAEAKEVCAKCLAKLEAPPDPTESNTAGPAHTEQTEAGTSEGGRPEEDFSSEEEEGSEEGEPDRECSANEGSDVEQETTVHPILEAPPASS